MFVVVGQSKKLQMVFTYVLEPEICSTLNFPSNIKSRDKIILIHIFLLEYNE